MNTKDKKHFCTCDDMTCPLHPSNHNKGCDLCIAKNLKKGEMPTCFFKVINNDVGEVKEFTIKSFVEFYNKNNQI